jgi:membrane protein
MLDIKTLQEFFYKQVWELPTGAATRHWPKWLIGLLRLLHVLARNLSDGQLTLRAMSLVYTTLLSLVPLLAVMFSVLKAFGAHSKIEPFLLNVLAPLGPKGVEITAQIIQFVDNMKVGVLGALGLGLLIYTVVALMQKIESSFNYTWHVTQQRRFAQRFSDYLSVIMIGPVLVVSAIGLTASIMGTTIVQTLTAIEPFGTLIGFATKLVPYLMIIGAFTFVYIFIPNTKVRLTAALVGALVGGVLWQTTGWIFASFVVNSTKYTAIYSAFASLIMFMIWLYVSWLILLVGASIAFYHQHPEYLTTPQRELRLSNWMRERLALLCVYCIGDGYYNSRPAYSSDDLARLLGVPRHALEAVLNPLEDSRLLSRTADEPPRYLPAVPFESTGLKRVLDTVREAGEDPYVDATHTKGENSVARLADYIDKAVGRALAGYTVKDLVMGETLPPASIKAEENDRLAVTN